MANSNPLYNETYPFEFKSYVCLATSHFVESEPAQ